MSWIDALIVVVPLAFVMYMAYRSKFYVKGVADFLSAGRVCGRYVISVADVATGLSVIMLVALVEANYKTGFAITFWQNVLLPLGAIMSLTGYCFYRFRETRAMSLGQFLEIRYNRSFRIFASALRTTSEILTNMICPAIAARFFLYFLGLPHKFTFLGVEFSTFAVVMVITLTLAITIIWFGGTLALVITDTIQGLICYPVLVVFVIFVLTYFSWSSEIVPVMMDRVPGESFLNPYDVEHLRDFNVFALLVMIFAAVLNRASWIGAGNTSAGRTPHEQKMAGVLGTWRTGFSSIFFILIAVMILTIMNHKNYSSISQELRNTITTRVADEVVPDPQLRAKLNAQIAKLPANNHTIGVDPALSQEQNIDTPYLDAALETLQAEHHGKEMFQEFRTLYNQIMLAITMRSLLPVGLVGLFCLLMVVMMVSTDDSRIFSSALTITQDIIVPLKKKPMSPSRHIATLRWCSVGVGVIFFCGSFFMSQLDYINLFVMIMSSIWLGGAGPVMIFGLYSRFGTTAGAFASLFAGMFISIGGVFAQRNWASYIYPYLDNRGWTMPLGNFLETISSPFEPYVVWRMNSIKFPINSTEIFFIAMILGLVAYCVVSLLTYRKPFNLERMLHRGQYSLDGVAVEKSAWTIKSVWGKLIGITPEYTKGDRIIAWSVFLYTFVYQFFIAFVVVIIWNFLSPWPSHWWGSYFLIVSLVMPGIVAVISTVWFSIGGVIDLRQLFKDLDNRVANNPLDDGRVEGNLSLADKAQLEKK